MGSEARASTLLQLEGACQDAKCVYGIVVLLALVEDTRRSGLSLSLYASLSLPPSPTLPHPRSVAHRLRSEREGFFGFGRFVSCTGPREETIGAMR
jgi:hypothetical protein